MGKTTIFHPWAIKPWSWTNVGGALIDTRQHGVGRHSPITITGMITRATVKRRDNKKALSANSLTHSVAPNPRTASETLSKVLPTILTWPALQSFKTVPATYIDPLKGKTTFATCQRFDLKCNFPLISDLEMCNINILPNGCTVLQIWQNG